MIGIRNICALIQKQSYAYQIKPRKTMKMSLKRSIVLISCLLSATRTAAWMVPSTGHATSLAKPLASSLAVPSRSLLTSTSSALAMSSTPDEDDNPKSKDENLMWKQIRRINDKFWDYTVNFFYVLISCGILLNLCGYGYTISKTEGLNIQTIDELRQEKLWQQEMQRYESEGANKKAVLKRTQILEKYDLSPDIPWKN